MLDTKLIIVTGISGTGKSTTAKYLSSVLQYNRVIHRYLHEECEHHPIREDEFCHGSHKSVEDMDRNCELMLTRWSEYSKQILDDGKLVILEACLYENIVRYFFECDYPESSILSFYDRLMDILHPLNPIIIHLRTVDVRGTFERAFALRGEWWKKLILEDRCAYFLARGYHTDDDNFLLANDYQELAIKAFNRVLGQKMAIDTTEQNWDAYHLEICRYLELRMPKPIVHKILNPLDYVGQYVVSIQNQKHGFTIILEDDKLYCRSFWPYMALEKIAEDQFTFQSFPIDLNFVREQGVVSGVKVVGDYDWGLCGYLLHKVTDVQAEE